MKNNTPNSQTEFLIVGLIIGLTYKIDLRPWGFDFHNFDLKGTLITILILEILMLWLNSRAVQETFIKDND